MYYAIKTEDEKEIRKIFDKIEDFLEQFTFEELTEEQADLLDAYGILQDLLNLRKRYLGY